MFVIPITLPDKSGQFSRMLLLSPPRPTSLQEGNEKETALERDSVAKKGGEERSFAGITRYFPGGRVHRLRQLASVPATTAKGNNEALAATRRRLPLGCSRVHR